MEELGEQRRKGLYTHLSKCLVKKGLSRLGYVAPSVEHEVSRKRFLQVYKGVQAGRRRRRRRGRKS